MTWEDVHALLPGLRAHDPAAWEELCALAHPVLASAVTRIVRNGWADASSSDVVQEVWMAVRAGFGTFRGADTPADTAACFRAWLRIVVRNVSIRELQKHGKQRQYVPLPITTDTSEPMAYDPTPSTQASRAEWQSRLEAAIARLGTEEQLIVRRNLYEGASCRQIALELGLADHTVVGGWRKEILATLRRTLGDE